MPIYRKKPVEIEARPWDGSAEGAIPIINWILGNGPRAARYHSLEEKVEFVDGKPTVVKIPAYIAIDTLEGTMKATSGDYVIKGIINEFYPCKPDVFEDSYEYVRD